MPEALSDLVPDPQDAPPLKWGILAPGGIANKLAEAVRDFTAGTVVAVGSRDAGRAAGFAERHGVARSYGSYEELVDDDEVEAVYVASPHSGHREHAVLAMSAGKHVLIEKALARNSTEVEEIFGAAQRSNVFAMEAMWTRHLPHMAEVRRRIEDGAIGEIVTVASDHGQALDLPNDHRLKNPQLAGGALLDLGVYPIAFTVDLLGVPEDIAATGRLTDTEVDGHVSLVLGFGPKTLAQIDTTLWTKTPTTAVISGTEGSIEIDGDFYGPNVARLRKTDRDRTVVEEWGGPIPNGFQFQVAEVARCVAEGKQESERMTWASSRTVMAIMDEARRQVGVRYPGE
ncbi:MAG TPA: Gfo/Idh/MocA family oxidoreductase [Lapillicoccus sp.]|nr:Gfo/Idh/MocA family oxidoreductase [Lapillicoccus sp.]